MLKDILHRPHFPMIITAYTTQSHLGDYYKRAVARFTKSCIKFDLPHTVFPLNPVSDWTHGCSLKPTVILHALRLYQTPVLWIDADAEIFQHPTIFENIGDAEMAIHSSKGGHWLSGTLYFKPRATHFVERWLKMTKSNEPDEITLLNLYRSTDPKHSPKLHLLPAEYNTVVHADSNTTSLVIGHHIRPDVAPSRKIKASPPPEI